MARSFSQDKTRVTFQIRADEGSTVYVAGSFNDWDPRKNRLMGKAGLYSATILLPKGRHEYKFIVNDAWCVDPECPTWTPNSVGSLNSVITVA